MTVKNGKKGEGVFLRDGRAPIPKSIAVSKVMRANKGRDTGPELMLRKAMWNIGMRGYRINMKTLPGRPDVVFTKKKIAIFVHGCFWHGCPICIARAPKTHEDFWISKFERNKIRDAKALQDLQDLGWNTMVIWECEVRNNLDNIINKIKLYLEA